MSKIKFIRLYTAYGHEWFDIVYHSGRVVTHLLSDLPKTAVKFIAEATVRKEQFDKVFNRYEMIYMA